MKLILTLLLLCTPTSFADILAEPYLSYHTGDLTAGSPSVTAKQTGVFLGARTGFKWKAGYMAGMDYGAGSWVLAAASGLPGGTSIPSYLGAFAGYAFEFPVRLYVTYDISAHLRVNRAGAARNLRGQGWRIGVGWQALEWLSVNGEFFTHTFTKDDVARIDPAIREQMYGVSLSFPFLWACTKE